MKTLFSTTGLLILLAILVIINVASGIFIKSSRLDLTENQLYTLSSGTKNILSELKEPIELRFYFSEKAFTGIPGVTNYGHRVRDLLEEYVSLSGGNLSLKVMDPEAFSEEEDDAVQYGLQGVPIDTTGGQAYFGLVGTESEKTNEVITFFQPDKEMSLEYDITRLISKLANPQQAIVGLLSTLPIEGLGMASNPMMPPGAGGQDWFILKQLKQSFSIKSLDVDIDQIPDDIDVLMLVHPRDLSDKILFAIDQFVLAGGHLLAFVDAFSEAQPVQNDPSNPMSAMQTARNSNIDKLLTSWGVELVAGKIATDRESAQRVQAQMNGRVLPMDYIAWLSLGENNLSQTDFVTRDIEKLGMATPGILKRLDSSNSNILSLIETSPQSMSVDAMQFSFGPNPQQLLRNFEASNEKLMLAVRITGKVNSAFPDGVEDSAIQVKRLKASSDKINVIVIADTDMLEDKHWVRIQNFFGNQIAMPLANNNVFVLNALENLSGSNDLISLRSRSKSTRQFTHVLALKRDAEKRFQAQERSLQAKLEQAEAKLAELQQQKSGAANSILSPEQEQEIEKFRDEQLETRKALRNVQHELVKTIESLGTTIKAVNIMLMPVLVIIFALIIGWVRRRRLVV